MSLLLKLIGMPLAVVGHLTLWIWAYNRLHAMGWPCRRIKRLEKATLALMALTLGLLAVQFAWWGMPAAGSRPVLTVQWTWLAICWAMAGYAVVGWCARQRNTTAKLVTRNHTTLLPTGANPRQQWIEHAGTRWAAAIPGNQILTVHCHQKKLALPGLPPSLSGLRIAQLSDLHMTGQMSQLFYRAAVDHVNRWEPDLIVITGDVVDVDRCLDWIGPTLGPLAAKYGVFSILGNHDQRVLDVAAVRQALSNSGITDLGSRAEPIRCRGESMLLAGNECPWFPPPPPAAAADGDRTAYRVLLSHTPDQVFWARENGFDLVLAGHTHGGQIRFPFIGPIVCPSRHGVRFASGVFRLGNTTLHVSRGLSGVHPLRFGCPPELTLLTLSSV